MSTLKASSALSSSSLPSSIFSSSATAPSFSADAISWRAALLVSLHRALTSTSCFANSRRISASERITSNVPSMSMRAI